MSLVPNNTLASCPPCPSRRYSHKTILGPQRHATSQDQRPLRIEVPLDPLLGVLCGQLEVLNTPSGEGYEVVGSSSLSHTNGPTSGPHAWNLKNIRKWAPQLNKPLGLIPTASHQPLKKRIPRAVGIPRAHSLLAKMTSLLYRKSIQVSQVRDHGTTAGPRRAQNVHEVLSGFILA